MKVNQEKEHKEQSQKTKEVIGMLESIRGQMAKIEEKQAAQEEKLEKLLEMSASIDRRVAPRIEDEFTGTWNFDSMEGVDAQQEASSGRFWLRHAQMLEVDCEKFTWWSVHRDVASLRITTVFGSRKCTLTTERHLSVLVPGIPKPERMEFSVKKDKLHIKTPFGVYLYMKKE